MYNLIRFYNQNRKKIFKIILIIVLIIAGIQLLNYFAKRGSSSKNDNIMVNADYYGKEVISDKSAISGNSVPNKKLKNETDVIKEFFDFCNKGDIEDAYMLITDECKDEMYPSIDDFKNIYYLYVFNGEKKSYTIENWSGDIYQVEITNDILSTGKLDNSETKQDYVTVVEKDNEYKLNINSYVCRKDLNKTTNDKNIKITVQSIDKYMDYEIYNLYIENDSENDIMLDSGDDTKSVYLMDRNEHKYYFYNNEIIENKLLVKSKFKNSLKIKFMSSYSSSKNIKKIVFSKMILNYGEYKKLDDVKQFDEFYEYRVNV